MTAVDAVLELAPHLQERLAGALESGLLSAPYTAASIRTALGVADEGQAISETLAEFDRLGMPGLATAGWIRAVAAAVGRTPRPDLVWSGPEVAGLHARDTRRVFEELISSAQHSVWACTYAYFDGPKAFELLARRMDETPQLEVTLLLNIQRRRGDKAAADELVRAFADRLWKTDWPGSKRPRVFFDPRAVDLEGPGGVLHAKAVVTDDESVFVTSANLTEAAFERNIEMGVLYRDRAFALAVASHFRVLIDRALLVPLPSE